MISLEITKLVRTGTSLAVVIPKRILRELFWERGDRIVFSIAEGDVICLRKATDDQLQQLKPKIIKI